MTPTFHLCSGLRLITTYLFPLLVSAAVTACVPDVTEQTATKPKIILYVNATTGNDAAIGTISAPLKTITRAMALSQSGDTVHVRSGTYNIANGEAFPIVVPAGVTLIGDEANKGAGGTPTVIAGAGNVAPFGTNFFTSPLDPQAGSTVAGFTITPAGAGSPNAVEALMLQQASITIRNNTITGGLDSGLYIVNGSAHTIIGNIFQGNGGPGLIFRPSVASLSRVESNVFTGNTYGVEFDDFGGDLGGGPTGSAGGNQLFCNSINDFWINLPAVPTVNLANNKWDHSPPTTVAGASAPDINNFSGVATLDTTGAVVVGAPCP